MFLFASREKVGPRRLLNKNDEASGRAPAQPIAGGAGRSASLERDVPKGECVEWVALLNIPEGSRL